MGFQPSLFLILLFVNHTLTCSGVSPHFSAITFLSVLFGVLLALNTLSKNSLDSGVIDVRFFAGSAFRLRPPPGKTGLEVDPVTSIVVDWTSYDAILCPYASGSSFGGMVNIPSTSARSTSLSRIRL